MNFYGYKRPDGRVGVRNKVLILPASVCASDTTRIISQQVVGSVTFNNQLGCSQVAPDQQLRQGDGGGGLPAAEGGVPHVRADYRHGVRRL